LAQVLGQRHPTLAVEADLLRAAEEGAGGAERLGPPLRLLPHRARHLLELLRRVHREAAAPALGDERTLGELVPVPRRQDHPAFGVQGVLVLPQEHRLPSLQGSCATRRPRTTSRPPLGTTSLHFVAPYTLPHHGSTLPDPFRAARATPSAKRRAPWERSGGSLAGGLRTGSGVARRVERSGGSLAGGLRTGSGVTRRVERSGGSLAGGLRTGSGVTRRV